MNARQPMRTWFLVGSLALALPLQGPRSWIQMLCEPKFNEAL